MIEKIINIYYYINNIIFIYYCKIIKILNKNFIIYFYSILNSKYSVIVNTITKIIYTIS